MNMHIDLRGKTALVSASTAGIGLATAIGLANAGATVILNGRSDDAIERAREAVLVRVPHANLRGVAADLATAEGAAALLKAEPHVDILVNNAGTYGPQDFFEIDDATWEHFFQLNVMSGVRLARHYLKGMLERDWGRVVFISSESALNIPADMIHYGMTKTAQLAVSRGLAKLAAGSGVTVNAVLPGPTLSEGVRAMLEGAAQEAHVSVEQAATDFVRTHRPSSILRRAASVDEVANMIVYVCSPQASATTGAALRVDGGVVDTIA
jgi:NAD(P)-dependent dehydrogenase (short-subunit alcohol dehydrogenase family)